VREAVGISSFGEEGDETPIEIVPDAVLDEPEGEGASGKTKAKAGADGSPR
jgi:hypothetical protein